MSASAAKMPTDLRDYAGVIHVHTRASDGTGTLDEVIEAAQRARCDFVIVTDHRTLHYRTVGAEGWYGDTLVIVGQEITPRINHLIALGIDRAIDPAPQERRGHVEEAARLGGLAFAVHPIHVRHYRRRFWRVIPHPWDDWNRPEIAGVELWSYMSDWVRAVNLFNPLGLARALVRPDSVIRGPLPSAVAEWDTVCQQRRVAAVGCVDAHQSKALFGLLCAFPYEYVFRTVRTHVLTPPFTGDFPTDERLLYEALCTGRAYVAYDCLADARGLHFTCTDGTTTWPMGEEIRSKPGLRLDVEVAVGEPLKPERVGSIPRWLEPLADLVLDLAYPSLKNRPAGRSPSIRLVKDGTLLRVERDTSLRHPVEAPGVYRIEVRLGRRPWIFSNPIYLRAPLGRA